MTTTNIKPNGTTASANATASTGTIHGCLSDGSDSTYVDVGDATHNGFVQLAMGTFALPAGAVTLSWTNNFRAKMVTASGSAQMYRQGSSYWSPTTVNNVAPGPYSNTYSDFLGVQPSTQADVDGYELYASMLAGDTLRLYDLSVDIKYVPIPTAAVSTPSGSVTTTLSPTVSWTHTAGSDAPTGQTKYRVKVFTAAQYGAGGFDPSTSAAAYDSGILAGSAASLVVGPLANSTSFRAYVQTAQTTLGQDQWSAWAFSAFSTSVTTPDITSVVVTADNTNGRHGIVVTRTATTPAWTLLEVQSSYDGGATWNYVRGFTAYAIPKLAVTATASTDLVNLAAHGLSAGQTVVFSGLTGGAGLVEGTPYFVIASGLTSSAFKVSTTSGGAAVNITTDMTAGSIQCALTVSLTDNEAPNGTAATYRARATYTAGGVITGAWTTSSSATWSSNDLWLKDVTTPSRNQVIYNVELPEPVYAQPRGVFRPLGAKFPVVVLDTRQAGESAITFETYTAAAETALRALADGATVMLLSAPAAIGFGWGHRYVVPGDLRELRPTQEIVQEWRLWSLGLTEVARPPDTGIS